MKYLKLKFLLIFAALAMAIPPAWAGTVIDEILAVDLPAKSSTSENSLSYTAFSNKTFSSTAVYAGKTANLNSSIAIRTKNSDAGIVTTTSGGKVRSITIKFNSSTTANRKVDIYGKNTAYQSASDLHDAGTKGELLGTAQYYTTGENAGTQVVTIDGNYSYVGIRSNSGAAYIDKITIVWETEGGDTPSGVPTLTVNPTSLTNINDLGGSFTVNGSNLGDDNVGVTTNNGFATNTNDQTWGFQKTSENPDGKLDLSENNGTITDGIVYVTYQGRELSASGTVVLDNNYLDPAVSVPVSYLSEVYIFNDNGNGSWNFTTGNTKMDYSNGEYTKTITIDNDNTCILFGRKTGENYRWEHDWTDGVHNRLFFGAYTENNGDEWMYGTNKSGNLDLNPADIDGHNKYSVIKFPDAGTYTITINAEAKTFSITSSNVYNLAEANALATNDGTAFRFYGDAVVTYYGKQGNNTYIWLRDKNAISGGGVLYKPNADELDPGTVLTQGWTANSKIYNQWIEYTNGDNISASSESVTVDPFDRIGVELKDEHENEYVKVGKLYIESTSTSGGINNYVANYVGENRETVTYTLRDMFNVKDSDGQGIQTGNTYEVIGTVGKYNSTIQLYPTSIEKVKELTITLESETKTALAGETIPVTVNIENAVGDYVATYQIGDGAAVNCQDGDVINITSEVAGEVTLTVNVLDDNGSEASATETYSFDAPLASEFVLVTDINQLEAGKQIIFVDSKEQPVDEMAAAMSKVQRASNRGATTVTVTESQTVSATADTEIFTLNKKGDYWLFRARKTVGYIYAAGASSSNDLKTGDITDNRAQATISIASEGEAIVTFNLTGDNARNTLKYNYSNSPTIFSCYKASANMRPVYIYVEKPATPEPVDPKLAFDEETPATVYVGDEITLTVNNVPEDAELSFTCDPEGAVTFGENGKATFNTAGEVTITANTTATDEYTAGTATFIINVEAKPKVETDLEGNNLDLVAVVGESETGTIIVSGTNLKGDITLTLNDEKGVFAIDVTSIAKNDAIGEVTVTYTPKAATGEVFDEANITIKSTDAEDVTVRLTGMATLPDPVLTVSTEALEMGTKPTDTFTVTGQHLTENVTVSIKEGSDAGFSVAPTSIEATNGAIENATVTVTYSGTSTTDAIATVVVKSGTASKEVIVSAHVLPTPVIEIDGETLDLGTTGKGTFDLLAEDLRGNITLESDNENFTVLPTTITPEEAEEGVTITVTYNGDNTEGETAHVTIKTEGAEDVVITVTAKAETYVALAAPTFAPAAGTYTEPKEVAIACATPGVTITYAIDGVDKGEYNGPFTISDGEHTVTATAMMGTRTVYTPATSSATYTINAADAANIADDYYFLQSNAAEVSGKYANVAGRRTLNFVADADKQAGTVFRVMTDPDTIGQVETLRSQAVDLQGYANRAMAYVPKVIDLVLSTLANSSLGDPETPGTGILGENGLDLILNKFYEGFDYNLYVEEGTEGTYRIYGRTPSMQHVVDFYHENTAQVEEKLPMLEGYINQVLDKIRSKIPAPYDANVVVPFSLKTVRDRIADKYGIALIDPTQDLMGFYRQVLNNKEYVWDFAYQTAMMYVDVIKQTGTYQNLPNEYKLYVEKMEKVRPDTKYYIIERGNELDYISENNGEIISNDPRTFWTLTKRENFTVNVPEGNKLNDSYYTTLYTDFAYELPTGVNAYAVTGIDENDVAQLTEITGAIPAQTPVLLKADAYGDKVLTLKTDSRGGAIEGNLLEGPDYLITKYQIKTPAVVSLFNMAQGFVPADVLADYEYLQLRYSGTVNNKYFWNVNSDLEDLQGDCVVRSLAVKNGTLAFSEHWTTETNKAFLVSDTKPVIYLEKETLAAPTFSPVPGSYTVDNGQNVTITITAEDDATIKYSTDGGKTWNTYEGPIAASDDMTIVAKAEKDGMIASDEVTAVYVIDNPAELPDVPVMKGYFQIKNNGNEKYAHVQGRKTLTFTDAPADKAGTVIWLETDGKGKVISLRSQAADLQRYADRAMSYVPDIVELVADKLNADGEGNLLGHEGLEKIMEKFNKSFDHHLYVEQAEGGYRLYGKTPSMQPVVEFYRENTAQVEAKLPMLEDFINSALNKLKEKIGGSSVFTPFSLLNIWERMGGTLTKPEDEASTMAFYREVLNNKNYVWDFAYQTAMIYLNNIKGTQTYQNLVNEHPEISQYIDKIDQIRPDFKYYIVADGDKPDFISEGNVDIKNNAARTIWTVEPRTKFTVNIDENNLFGCPLADGVGGYATTLYTDFAYTVPDGVTAYKVTSIEGGKATIEALSGVIPAQTPVLLTAKEAGNVTLTLSTEAGTAVSGNLLYGPDYLINEYDLKTEQVQSLFDQIKAKMGQSFYDTYVAQYEYLADLNSGTVNNKYFWGLKQSDVEKCSNDGGEDCVVRNLSGDKFIDNWKVETNKAFLVTDEYNEITFNTLHGDVNHDGLVNIEDVTDLIDRLLGMPDAYHLKACEYCSDVNKNGTVKIDDVTTLIDILLGIDGSNQATDPQGGE